MIRPGLINLDFADVRSVMDEMGKAMMGTGEATTEEFPEARAKAAAQAAIANPLLDEVSLSTAKGVLINVMGGLDMTLHELSEASDTIKACVDGDANIHVGSAIDEAMEGRIRVSVVATGIDAVDVDVSNPVPRRSMAEPMQPARRQSDAPELEHGFAEAPAPFGHAPPQPRGGGARARSGTAPPGTTACRPRPTIPPRRRRATSPRPRPRRHVPPTSATNPTPTRASAPSRRASWPPARPAREAARSWPAPGVRSAARPSAPPPPPPWPRARWSAVCAGSTASSDG